MTLDEANVLRTLIAKRIVPRDAEEGLALMQLAGKVYDFIAQHQLPLPPPAPAPVDKPAVQVADTTGK